MLKIIGIIVTYNRSALLQECIEAILHSDYRIDIMIIDNASTDNTRAIVEQASREVNLKILYFNTNKNIGGAGGFNYGIAKAYGLGYDFFWLMDDDVMVQPSSLSELLKVAESVHFNFGWLSSLALWTDGKECGMNHHEVASDWNDDKKGILEGRLKCNTATFVSLFVKREVVEKIGLPIKEYFIWGDDTEYTKRISNNYPCYFVPTSQVVHKMRANESTKRLEEIDELDRIERMYYSIRNDLCTARRNGMISLLKYLWSSMKTLFRVFFSSVPYKSHKVKVLLKGLWAGIWFCPKIEKIN